MIYTIPIPQVHVDLRDQVVETCSNPRLVLRFTFRFVASSTMRIVLNPYAYVVVIQRLGGSSIPCGADFPEQTYLLLVF